MDVLDELAEFFGWIEYGRNVPPKLDKAIKAGRKAAQKILA